jgi:hypothetical protein
LLVPILPTFTVPPRRLARLSILTAIASSKITATPTAITKTSM